MGCHDLLTSSDLKNFNAWALVDFASWCCASKGLLANTISGIFAAVQYFHRLKVAVELPVTGPVVQCALRGIAQTHVTAGTPCHVRLPVSFGMLLAGKILMPTGRLERKGLLLCLCLSCFLMTRSGETFGADSRVVHPVHCLARGDMAFCANGTQSINTRGQ